MGQNPFHLAVAMPTILSDAFTSQAVPALVHDPTSLVHDPHACDWSDDSAAFWLPLSRLLLESDSTLGDVLSGWPDRRSPSWTISGVSMYYKDTRAGADLAQGQGRNSRPASGQGRRAVGRARMLGEGGLITGCEQRAMTCNMCEFQRVSPEEIRFSHNSTYRS